MIYYPKYYGMRGNVLYFILIIEGMPCSGTAIEILGINTLGMNK